MIKEAYVSYEIAQLLKKKGFNWECRTCYEHGELKTEVCRQYADWNSRHEVWELMSAPTHQMVMKWLREEKKIYIRIIEDAFGENYHFEIYSKNPNIKMNYCVPNYYESTYEDAVESALKYVLENLL